MSLRDQAFSWGTAWRRCAWPCNSAPRFSTGCPEAHQPIILLVMSDYHCTPASGPLHATVTLPGSKSITNRALVCAALADGTSLLSNLLLADDTRIMMAALRALGIALTVDEAGACAEVTGCRGHLPASDAKLFCGNSGTTIRFCTALTALGGGRYELDGVERMRQRPLGQLAQAVQALGSGIEYQQAEGYPPLTVHAHGLSGGQVQLVAPESSQYASALLLAGPYARRDLMLEVTGQVVSAPYLRMTTALMERFAVPVLEQYDAEGARFVVEAPRCYQGQTLSIEPDASNASYFLAAAALAGGTVTVEHLGTDSTQGDVHFVDLLEQAGCKVERRPTSLSLTGPDPGRPLRGLDLDLNKMPDLVQTWAVLALFAEGATTVRNVANLRLKETDRLAALCAELRKLGAQVEEFPDGLRLVPPVELKPAEIDTYDDHRMAMSFSLAGLRVPGLVIRNADCCGKTFPDFFNYFEHMRDSAR